MCVHSMYIHDIVYFAQSVNFYPCLLLCVHIFVPYLHYTKSMCIQQCLIFHSNFYALVSLKIITTYVYSSSSLLPIVVICKHRSVLLPLSYGVVDGSLDELG